MRPFVHLHLHTQYSLLCGAVRLKPLAKRLDGLNMPAIALTDRNNMFGAVDFQKKVKGAKVKPLIGLETFFVPELSAGVKVDTRLSGPSRPAHLVLIAQDLTGYANLRQISSDAYLKTPRADIPCIDFSLLEGRTEGLIALSGGVLGVIERAYIEKGEAEAEALALRFNKLFPSTEAPHFYLEVQPLKTARQESINQFFKQLSARHQLPLVATNECYYMDREDARAYHALTCIAEGSLLNEYQDEYTTCDEHYLKDGDTIAAQLGPDFEQAIDETLRIAERCSLEIPLGKTYLPQYEVPEGFNEESFLDHRAEVGLKERFEEFRAQGLSFDEPTYHERLKMELDVIKNMKFPGYFLIVQDFINWAKDHDIPVGPGRGSGAGSLVAYALRITDLDPIPYGLLFERFLNPERVSMPDFDIDFCMNRRQEVIDYVTRKYGAENVGQIATFGALKAKGVIKDVGRVVGLHYSDSDRLSKLVPEVLNITLDEALKQEERLAKIYETDRQIRDLIDIARSLEGLHRNTGMHAAGIVIGDEVLWHYCPVFKGGNGELITQFAKDEVEEAGLVKFDFLGLKTLTVIQDAVDMVNKNHPDEPELDVYKLPLTDRAVYQLISSGETEGVFQLESSGFQELLKKLKPDVFEDIVAAVALYRPGPLNSGMLDTFINRKHGREEIIFPHELIRGILTETYGVIVYQEQVMQIAQVLANFSLGSADILRRAMGKKKMDVMAQQRIIFAEGAAQNGVSERVASEIFDLMEMFAEYGFNKSHSAAYALLTYHTAFLKAHHPAEFMASVLSNDRDTAEKVAKGVRNSLRMGLTVSPPCVNRSLEVFYGRGEEIIFGLGGIKGVGSSAVEAIIEARDKGGPFTSLKNFCERVNLQRVNKSTIEKLILVGAFDYTELPRKRLAAAVDTFVARGQKKQKDEAAGQDSFFSMFETKQAERSDEGVGGVSEGLEPWANVGEWTQKQLLENEKSNLGFYVSGHPLDRFEQLVKEVNSTQIYTLPSCDRFQQVTLIGLISGLRTFPSKQGGRIGFATIEDQTGEVELFLGSPQVEAYESILGSGEPVMIIGEVKHSRGDEEAFPKVDIGRRGEDPRSYPFVQTLTELQVAKTKALEVYLPSLSEPKLVLQRLKALCLEGRFQGRVPLFVRLHTQRGAEVSLSTPFNIHPDEELAHELRQLAEGVAVQHLGQGAIKAMQREVTAGQRRAQELSGVSHQ